MIATTAKLFSLVIITIIIMETGLINFGVHEFVFFCFEIMFTMFIAIILDSRREVLGRRAEWQWEGEGGWGRGKIPCATQLTFHGEFKLQL